MKPIVAAIALSTLASLPSVSDSLIYAYNDKGEHRIHIKNIETGEDTIVTPAGGAAWNATFSPSGDHFVYTWQKGETSHVFIAPVDGGEHKQLTEGPLVAFHPSFSPDGNHIIFTDWSNRSIAIMNRDGTDRHLLTESEERNSHPVFFQDGKRILFTSYRDRSAIGDPGIFIYNVENAEVSHTGYYGTYARPSHDGDWIVFSGKRHKNAERDIAIAELDSDSPIKFLTEGGGYDGHPAFTEDDQSIVFVSRMAQSPLFPSEDESDTAGTNEVFLMDRDGTNVTRLTSGEAVAWHPEVRKGPLGGRNNIEVKQK